MANQNVILVIGGGIAAYKCLDLIRRLRERGARVRVIMTKAATEFVTPLSVGALTNERVFTDLFDLDDEREIGHIRLARDCDVVVVAPATADLMAKMAGGHANDLATAVLLATDRPVLIAPAMNPHMWRHPATARNAAQLLADGVRIVGPNSGEMAERGEAGVGRMAEVPEIIKAIDDMLSSGSASGRTPSSLAHSAVASTTTSPAAHTLAASTALTGRHVLVTAGPTHEPIDPVRYIANRSSGRQGFAIAAAAAAAGARVTLISGPVELADPPGVDVRRVVTAAEMLEAVKAALPADIAVFAAAVADWRVAKPASEKIKKSADSDTVKLKLTQNPDILRTIASHAKTRPAFVIGFAAETENVLPHARKKLKSKNADWIVANDVSPESGVMGGSRNTVHIVSKAGIESWPEMSKETVAEMLIAGAARQLASRRSAAE